MLSLKPDPSKDLVVYTDGGCIGNPGRGAWAYIVIDGENEQEHSGSQEYTTNNRMELRAVIEALLWIKEHHKGKNKVKIHVDSQYVRNGITEWITQWNKNGWLTSAKQPVKNQDLWQELQKLDQEQQPEWRWVKAHAGNLWNQRCDQLVRKAQSVRV